MLTVMVILAASPAMASHDDDGWWDDCEWAWSPGEGWFVICDVDDDFWVDDSDSWDDDDECWEWSWVHEKWDDECDHDWNWWDRDRDRDRNWGNRDWDDDDHWDNDDGVSFSIGDADNESGSINFS